MFCLNGEKRIIKITLAVTCSVFLLVCLYSIFRYGNATLLGNLSKPNNDDVKFIRSAWILAQTGNYVYHKPPQPTVFMMPGLPFFLAFLVLIFGKFGAITAFRVVQAVVQTLSLLLTFFIGRKVFNSKVGAIAVVLSALYFVDVWVSNLILTETFFKFFVLALAYFSIWAIQENKARYYILAALAWGLATLFRPTIATYPIVILFIWLIRKFPVKEMLKYALLSALVFCAVLSPWWIRNYEVFHKFIPLTLATGNPFLQGTYINYDQSSRLTDGLNYSQFKYPASTEIANNAVEMAIGKYRLAKLVPKHPLQFLLWYTVGKAFWQLNFPFYWVPILGVPIQAVMLCHYLALVTALLGILLYLRNKDTERFGMLLLATIVYFILVYLPFYAFSRYFYPAMPFVFIFAAYYVLNYIENREKEKNQLSPKVEEA